MPVTVRLVDGHTMVVEGTANEVHMRLRKLEERDYFAPFRIAEKPDEEVFINPHFVAAFAERPSH